MQALPPNDYIDYPLPLTTYDEVLTSQTRFRETLENFHMQMQTKFKIPVIGGNDLDLHRLFVLVTSRGGFCKVNREKRWTEVYGAFKFPISATNYPYLVRKHYFSLLLHYERVYFLRAEAWSPSELDALKAVSFPKMRRRHDEASSSTQYAGLKRLISEPEVAAPTVTLEPKSDVGYYVTGRIGSDKLHGVLYRQAAQPPPNQPVAAVATVSAAAGEETRRKRRKKAQVDPNKPKGKQSAYNYFFATEYHRLRPSYHGMNGHINIIKEIGANWRKLPAEERAVYDELARVDKARYDLQMDAYNESLKSGLTTQPVLALPLYPHAEVASSSHYGEVNLELSLALTVQPATFGPDLNGHSGDA